MADLDELISQAARVKQMSNAEILLWRNNILTTAVEELEKKYNQYKKGILEDAEKYKAEIHVKATEEALSQIKIIFRVIIQQYYSYETKYYIRHGERRRGTGIGHNLYKAANFRTYGTGRKMTINFDINATKMLPYKEDPQEKVLETVMTGHRGKISGWTKATHNYQKWSFTYQDQYIDSMGKNMKNFFRSLEEGCGDYIMCFEEKYESEMLEQLRNDAKKLEDTLF